MRRRPLEPLKIDGVSINKMILEKREESERRVLAAPKNCKNVLPPLKGKPTLTYVRVKMRKLDLSADVATEAVQWARK